MKDIVIYKSSSGVGGSIDRTFRNEIFLNEVDGNRFSCLYIKNEGNSNKTILSISTDSVDDIQLGIQSSAVGVPIGHDVPILTSGYPPYVSFDNARIFPNIDIQPEGYIAIWLYLSVSNLSIKKEHNVNLNIEWIDTEV